MRPNMKIHRRLLWLAGKKASIYFSLYNRSSGVIYLCIFSKYCRTQAASYWIMSVTPNFPVKICFLSDQASIEDFDNVVEILAGEA